MILFVDGPVMLRHLELQRAPLYLRVVCRPHMGGDEMIVDALDQLEDQASPEEYIHVYLRIGPPGVIYVDGTDPKTRRRYGRRLLSARYMHYDKQPEQSLLADNKLWREWVTSEDHAHALELVKKKREETDGSHGKQ